MNQISRIEAKLSEQEERLALLWNVMSKSYELVCEKVDQRIYAEYRKHKHLPFLYLHIDSELLEQSSALRKAIMEIFSSKDTAYPIKLFKKASNELSKFPVKKVRDFSIFINLSLLDQAGIPPYGFDKYKKSYQIGGFQIVHKVTGLSETSVRDIYAKWKKQMRDDLEWKKFLEMIGKLFEIEKCSKVIEIGNRH